MMNANKRGKVNCNVDFFFFFCWLWKQEFLARGRCNMASYCSFMFSACRRFWFVETVVFQSSFPLGVKTVNIKFKLDVERCRATTWSFLFGLLLCCRLQSWYIKGVKLWRAFSASNRTTTVPADTWACKL